MFSEAHPLIRRAVRFLMLPYCYFKLINFKECTRSKLGIALDLLDLFFRHKTYPDNYGPCRLWEVEKSSWKYYYGSSYHPYQRKRLRSRVQRYEYQILFNDKAVCEQLCRGTGIAMPHTYGILYPDQNYKEKITLYFNESSANSLIIKPILGHAGLGIVLAKKDTNGIFIQSKKGCEPLSDFVLKENAIVQEVLSQDSRISAFSSSSINTIRVVTLFANDESIIVMSATMRFSVGTSFVDNWSAGGVAVGVDCDTGKLKKYAYDKKGRRYVEHPTSKLIFEHFVVPEWDKILELAKIIQKACPFYRLLGMDIAIQKNGQPTLIEVNANSDLIFQEQTSGPLLKNERILKAFGEYGLFVNNIQKKLFLNLSNT